MKSANAYVCQIGARENYSYARALAKNGRLSALITDHWSQPGAWSGLLNAFDRSHSDLLSSNVKSASKFRIIHQKLTGRGSTNRWSWMHKNNLSFQRFAVRKLMREHENTCRASTVFAYSYAACGIFEWAKKVGLKTVLLQIDPGPVENQIVKNAHQELGLSDFFEEPPLQYWDDWWKETDLADVIVVNSSWSRQSLIKAGVERSKIKIFPLVLEPSKRNELQPHLSSSLPQKKNGLRVLFLGQVNVRKGAIQLLEAAKNLSEIDVHFDLVGDIQVPLKAETKQLSNVTFHGRVARHQVEEYYNETDVFILPTLSDGFALTQLEAFRHGVPVIASGNCGDVVEDGVTGLRLKEVTPEAIESSIRKIAGDRRCIEEYKKNIASASIRDIDDLYLFVDEIIGVSD